MGLFNKKELNRIEVLEAELTAASSKLKELQHYQDEVGLTEHIEISKAIETKQIQLKNDLVALEAQISNATKVKENAKKEVELLNSEIDSKKKEIISLETEITMQDFGLYKPIYDCMGSTEYSNLIALIRDKQKNSINSKSALSYNDNWTLDGSKSKGRAMNNDCMKMVLRAFNYECDTIIAKVKFNNFEKMKERIIKSAEAINKLNIRNQVIINQSFIELKINELHAVHEYNRKKQEEKEAMRAAREEEREAMKLQKEIEEARKNITKDKSHYEKAKADLEEKLKTANDEDSSMIEEKIKEINSQLEELSKKLQEVDYRESNQKAGYVYVVSNIGAFGEGIYKIGMTRRLDPQDRVDELGDASVPFTFDVHAMIFSNDAPKLEATLHNAFSRKRVNMVNNRKEFFKISLDEIEKVVKENHDQLSEFKKIAEAEQFRETTKLQEINRSCHI